MLKKSLKYIMLGGLASLFGTTQAVAMDIGPMTAIMEPTTDFIVRTITNNDTSVKVYEVRANKISNPTASGQPLAMSPGELLYTPKRFVLQGGQMQNVKFYYKGGEDESERYYQVNFTESPAAQPDQPQDKQRKGALELKIEMQSILVVRPRKVKFNYELDEVKGTIRNSGNTFFEFMVKQGCDEPDSKADTKYLLPGETWHNAKIAQPSNHKVIVYASRFITIGQACKPA